MQDGDDLGALLRRHRQEADLTIEDLAAASGVSDRGIGDIERGVSRGPQHRTVQALADALGLAAADRAVLLRVARAGRRRTHDLGFLYTLSCVTAWRRTGDDAARTAALAAA
ncbi:helix-turn-helix transcriptional regulator, partial [Cellulomonas hominis]